jgi:hypothetical protein
VAVNCISFFAGSDIRDFRHPLRISYIANSDVQNIHIMRFLCLPGAYGSIDVSKHARKYEVQTIEKNRNSKFS